MKWLLLITLLAITLPRAHGQGFCCGPRQADTLPAMGVGLRLSTTLSYLLDGGAGIEADLRYPVVGRWLYFNLAPGYAASSTKDVYTNWDYRSRALFLKAGFLITPSAGIRYTYANIREYGDFVLDGDFYGGKEIYHSSHVYTHGLEIVAGMGKNLHVYGPFYFDITGTVGWAKVYKNDRVPVYNMPLAGLIHNSFIHNMGNGLLLDNAIYLGFHFSVYWYAPVRSLCSAGD